MPTCPLTLNEPVTFARCADAIFLIACLRGPPGPEGMYDDKYINRQRQPVDSTSGSLRSQLYYICIYMYFICIAMFMCCIKLHTY